MKRIIIFMTVIALILGLSNAVYAVNYMKSAQNALKVNELGLAMENARAGLAESDNSDPEFYALIGDIYFISKNYPSAVKNWENAVRFKFNDLKKVDDFKKIYNLKKADPKKISPKQFWAKRAEQMFVMGCSQLTDLRAATQFFTYAQRFGYPADDISKAKIDYGESILQSVSNRKEALAAVPYIGQASVDEVFPEIIWQTVLTKIVDGRGVEDGKEIDILVLGRETNGIVELQKGDQVKISGDLFWHSNAKKWTEYKGDITIDIQNSKCIRVGAEEGREIKVEVIRKIVRTSLAYNN